MLGGPKIGYLESSIFHDQDIGTLEVSVDYILLMKVGQSFENLPGFFRDLML